MKPIFARFARFLILILFVYSCGQKKTSGEPPETQTTQNPGIKVIFDTDANNELDDQHALAYLLFNADYFDVLGVTVNATFNGGDIKGHYQEADRILELCSARGLVPLMNGANENFTEITKSWDPSNFDGQEAVDFLLEQTKKNSLVIIAVGKLTNMALALKKDPTLAERCEIVWLGSNYPEPGEYNQDNDTTAMNFVLNSRIPFQMVTVRYGKPSGTDAVRVTQQAINDKMPGLGPRIEDGVTGRHGGVFHSFGDYSVNLFEHIDYHGDPPSRALFDMVAVAILKNPEWGEMKQIPAPVLMNNKWVDRPSNDRKIVIWENFDSVRLLEDFYESIQQPSLIIP